MALFYVTGLSGTGKSAILNELRARGYCARGVDEDGYAEWITPATGRPDPFPHKDPGVDFHAWYAAHDWVLSARRISVLRRAAARLGKPVFLCGFADGADDVRHLFDKIAALVADEQTIRRRLVGRPDEFGKTDEELADVLFWLPRFEEMFRGLGATVIDATRPLPDVVAEILSLTMQPEHGTLPEGHAGEPRRRCACRG